jgi:hypothetical protein
MASTRSKNNKGDYALKQAEHENMFSNRLYEHNAYPSQSHLPGDGLLQGQMGPMKLAQNFADVESFLRGTGSVDLVNDRKQIVPILNNLQSVSIIDKTTVHIPEPLVVEHGQRPSYQK